MSQLECHDKASTDKIHAPRAHRGINTAMLRNTRKEEREENGNKGAKVCQQELDGCKTLKDGSPKQIISLSAGREGSSFAPSGKAVVVSMRHSNRRRKSDV